MTANPAPRGRALGRTASLVVIAAIYLAATAVAVVVVDLLGDDPLLAITVALFAATGVVYLASLTLRNGSCFDAYWSVAPPLVAVYWLTEAAPGADGARQVLVTTLVFLWGIRLTLNWARSWPGLDHEDWRYTQMYRDAPLPTWAVSLLGVHFFPTVQIALGCLALRFALATGTDGFGVIDVVAGIVTIGAIAIETIADEQRRAFARTAGPGEWCRSGLWARSRHPNYFGEVAFWCGLYGFALAADLDAWWTIVGPVAMIAMMLAASVPMMDRRNAERRPGYAEATKGLPALVPRGRGAPSLPSKS
ncbi:MAG: DUF1295 domain-containing protein [Acidimicrobiia bacterium]